MEDLQVYIRNYFGIPKDRLEEVARLFEMEKIQKAGFFIKAGQQCNKLSFI